MIHCGRQWVPHIIESGWNQGNISRARSRRALFHLKSTANTRPRSHKYNKYTFASGLRVGTRQRSEPAAAAAAAAAEAAGAAAAAEAAQTTQAARAAEAAEAAQAAKAAEAAEAPEAPAAEAAQAAQAAPAAAQATPAARAVGEVLLLVRCSFCCAAYAARSTTATGAWAKRNAARTRPKRCLNKA